MRQILLIVYLAVISAITTTFGADRVITQTVDITTARVQPAAIGFFRGESVAYTVVPLYGSSAISVSTNATATWTIATQTNVQAVVLNITGTVSTNGACLFSAPVSNTTMAAGAYDSFVRIQDGATLVTASRTTLNVYKSPYPESPSVVPYSWSEPLWLAAASQTNTWNLATNSTPDNLAWQSNAVDAVARATNTAQDIVIAGKLDPSATNGFISSESDPIWSASSNTVVYTNDSRLTDARGWTGEVNLGSAAYADSNRFATVSSLGSAAYSSSNDFATSAQGSLAEQAVLTNTFVLKDGSGVNSLSWGPTSTDRILYDANNNGTVLWGSHFLSAGNARTIDWSAKQLLDSADAPAGVALDWDNRTLNNSSGTAVLDWSDGVQVSEIQGALATNGNGSALTDITALQVGALSTNGGTVANCITSPCYIVTMSNMSLDAAATIGYVDEAIARLQGFVYYGTTNAITAPWVAPSNMLQFSTTAPGAWTNSFALGTSETLVGFRVYSNVHNGGTVSAGAYEHHVNMGYSQSGGATIQYRSDLILYDGATTQTIAQGSTANLTTTGVQEYDSSTYLQTNVTMTSSQRFGVARYAVRVGGASATLNIYGGTGHASAPVARLTRLEGPATQITLTPGTITNVTLGPLTGTVSGAIASLPFDGLLTNNFGGAVTLGSNLNVAGSATITNNLTVGGSITLGGVAQSAWPSGGGTLTNWIDATAIGVGAESVFPTYNVRTNANGAMYVLAWDKTVANSWAGPFTMTPNGTVITTFWKGYHSTTGTTALAFRWRDGLNAWTVSTSALLTATGSNTALDTLTFAVSNLTAGVPIETEISTINTNSGTSAGFHYMKHWGWSP